MSKEELKKELHQLIDNTEDEELLSMVKEDIVAYQIKAKYSQFVANGLMVGGSIEGAKDNLSRSLTGNTFKVDALVRYYVPLTKKLFIYPEAKVTYADLGVGRFYYEFGVGMNYFLKKNVALDIDVFRLGASQGQTNTFLGANVGLKYFLK